MFFNWFYNYNLIMEVQESILIKLKSINGKQYLLIGLFVIFLKYSLGFYITGSRNISLSAVIMGNILSIFQLIISLFRAYRFKDWKLYFTLLIFIGVIHSIGYNLFPIEVLINSRFNILVKITTLASLLIFALLTISNSNKQ